MAAEAWGERVDGRGGESSGLLLFFTGNVCLAAGLIIHAFSFNFYLRDLGYTAAAMGDQVTAMTAGGLLALLPAGIAIDRFGTRATLLGGVLITSVALVLAALAREIAVIQAMAVLIGVGGATCRVAWGPAIMQLADERRRARIFTWNVALLIGTGAAWTALAGAIPRWSGRSAHASGLSGVQLALLGGAALSAAALPCYWRLHVAPSTQRRFTIPTVALPREMRPIIGGIAAWMLASALVAPFFNIFFTDRFAMPMGSVGSLFALAHVANALLLLAAAEVARRYGPRRALSWWMIALAPSLWGLAAASALPVAVALFFVQGLVGPATNPLIDQLVLERVDRTRRGVVAGWRNAAAEISGGIGASLGGHVVDAASFNTLFIAAGAVAGATAVLLSAMLRSSPARALAPDAMEDPA